ncbi:hypothetical protein BZA77DRAFT_41340 [Pyronema omphalodes]|nr:hypothetical protein BZA77DRAFT_41340 [Pyronema omphalodes]
MKAFQTALLVALAGLATAIEDASYYGCYSSAGSMNESIPQDTFMAVGACRPACTKGTGFAVMAMTKGTSCWCGNTFPAKSYRVDDTKCKQPCGGYDKEMCGSRLGEYFSVYKTGLEKDPDTDPEGSSSASKTSTSSGTSSTSLTSTTTTSASEGGSSGVNKAGVAAGAVVGVLAVIAVAVGFWVFLRKRRRQKVEEEYRKSAAVRGFVQKPASDHRLDPGMVQRRDSVGSIADNQDYSRRILKVTNPDG